MSTTDLTGQKGLKTGALGLVSSVVVGMASTAPAYSLAAALGFIVLGGETLVGFQAPGIILLAFVPMFFISVAYKELNRVEPDCGTVFTWAARAFGTRTGWMGGWALIAADIIVMANLAQIAGSYSFTFVGEVFNNPEIGAISGDVFWSTFAGLIWIFLMTWIAYRGVEISAKLQYWLLAIEVIILIAFASVALFRVFSGNGIAESSIPELSWFNPFTLPFETAIAPAVLTALFIYWGWDTAVAINEETSNPEKTPGNAAVISTLLLVVTYLLVTVGAVAFAGVGETGIGLGNPDNAGDIFAAVGPTLFGDSILGHIMMLLLAASILTSAAASTQTTILPTARGALSMAAYKALPSHFTKMHPKFLTPTWATWGMGIISAAFYLIFTLVSPDLLVALIGALGLLIAVYYGLTGFAATWFFRKTLFMSTRNFFMRGLIPFLGGTTMAIVFVYGLQQFLLPDWLVDANGNNVTIFGAGAVGVVGLMSIALGAFLMIWWNVVNSEYFKGKTLEKRAHTAD
ncbi:APC family permease [Aurantimicrobium photophilum]|jgi:amino acid transporter|uniref:Putative amino acid permease YhdG n=2 Tax=Aurantimicrobium TaxID=1705353 RepID=A0A2Z3S0H5_9MICO|nr:APC family permease [Aurantimicrobium photophilum]AWR21814.1 putative amino acid permease YhdG [Aurantimicrobium photophilum]